MMVEEFIQHLKKLARQRSIEFRLESKRGQGQSLSIWTSNLLSFPI